jgi:hypothetical protein
MVGEQPPSGCSNRPVPHSFFLQFNSTAPEFVQALRSATDISKTTTISTVYQASQSVCVLLDHHSDPRRAALEHDGRNRPLLLLILDRRLPNRKSQIHLPPIDGFDCITVGLTIAAMAPMVEIDTLLFASLFSCVLICVFSLSLFYLFRLPTGVGNSDYVLQQFR